MLKNRALALLTGVILGALVLGVGVSLGSFIRIPPSYSPPNHEESAQPNPQSPEKIHPGNTHYGFTAEEWIAIATLILAVGTVLLAGATIELWIVTRRGVKTQIDDTRILQRAYLAVVAGGVDPFEATSAQVGTDSHKNKTVAHIIVRNTGNLPARNVSWFIDYTLSPNGSLDAFPIDDNRVYGSNVVSPGADMWRSQTCELDPTHLIGFDVDQWHLYIWGEVKYIDGFGAQRFTRFCHRYNKDAKSQRGRFVGKGQSIDVPILRAEDARLHRFGNNAD